MIVYNCHRVSISYHKSLFDQDMDHSNFADPASNTLYNRTLWHSLISCRKHLSSFFTLPFLLRWSDIVVGLTAIIWYTETLMKVFLWLVISDFACQLHMDVACSSYLQNSYLHCEISQTRVVLSDHKCILHRLLC